MTAERDYDTEIRDTSDHKYVYGFDFDVMHPLMIRSFLPFFRPGSVLELGSFKGDFTDLLLPHFSDVTCVEASGEALEEQRARHGDRVRLVHSRFEDATLPERYANVVLTHVLEHIDDRVGLLRRIGGGGGGGDGPGPLLFPHPHTPPRASAGALGPRSPHPGANPPG